MLDDLNLNYSKDIWQRCTQYGIPLIYASSAATYGNGELGYDDEHGLIQKLKPLNPYGVSKNEFDKWVLQQTETPPFWCGLKFFNVYGPNEYHKSRMASVVFHGFNQIRESGCIRLFRSYRREFNDGEQRRDFIYVKDVTEVLLFFFQQQKSPGIYNLGTGIARTFLDLAYSTFQAMSLPPDIRWIEMPADIRDNYQYFTQANMQKLRSIGYVKPFYSLEEGVREYVQQYLLSNKIW